MPYRFKGFALMTLVAVAAAAAFWLLRDHWGHALGFAPYLLFLACPLVHLFMHSGHEGHSHRARQSRPASRLDEAFDQDAQDGSTVDR